MKKKLLLLFLPILMLTGCNNSSGGALPVKEREKVELNVDNYSKYIAVYTISDSYATSDSPYGIYRYQLVGSSLCKFDECSITYSFMNNSSVISEEKYTVKLTISGCGETKDVRFYYGYGNYDTEYFRFKAISASGIVEILY